MKTLEFTGTTLTVNNTSVKAYRSVCNGSLKIGENLFMDIPAVRICFCYNENAINELQSLGYNVSKIGGMVKKDGANYYFHVHYGDDNFPAVEPDGFWEKHKPQIKAIEFGAYNDCVKYDAKIASAYYPNIAKQI